MIVQFVRGVHVCRVRGLLNDLYCDSVVFFFFSLFMQQQNWFKQNVRGFRCLLCCFWFWEEGRGGARVQWHTNMQKEKKKSILTKERIQRYHTPFERRTICHGHVTDQIPSKFVCFYNILCGKQRRRLGLASFGRTTGQCWCWLCGCW